MIGTAWPPRTTVRGQFMVGLSLLLAVAGTSASEVRDYEWLTSGRVTGAMQVTVKADGARHVTFGFNDRGRGPRITEQVRFDKADRVVSLEIDGQAYMGAPVEERFRRQGTTASWQSNLERGESESMDGVYLAAEGSPEQQAVLARALLSSPDGSLWVLPSGHATIQAMDEFETGPPGDRRTATLFAISGLDFTPAYLWLDQNRELLAVSASWMGMVPAGWGEFLPEFAERQQFAEARHAEALARNLTRTLPPEYALVGVNVLEVDAGRILAGHAVVVRDGRIERVSASLPDDFGGTTIDARGGFLVPGLWDMHTHVSTTDGMQHIAGGVTMVRDLGNNPGELAAVRDRFETGHAIGPGVVAAGFIDARSPFSAPIETLAESEDDAIALVRQYAGQGYTQVKIYSSIDPRWVPGIAQETHAHGMRLSGHIPNGMSAAEAVLAGFDEIQHINMLFLNFLAGPEVDTRTPARFSVVADGAAGLDLSSPPVTDFISLLSDRQVVVDPTVAIFEGMFAHVPGTIAPGMAMVADHLPAAIRRQLLSSRMNGSAQEAKARSDDAQALLDMIGLLHRAGVRIVAGTDSMPGFMLHRELELYVKAGIPAAAVLRLATLGAAEVMSMAGDYGSIETGKRADLVLLGANPLEDINALRRPLLVVRGQRAWQPARLHEAMGVQPFTPLHPSPFP